MDIIPKGNWIADHNSSVVLTLDSEGEVEHVIARHIIELDIDLISAAPEMYKACQKIVEMANAPRIAHLARELEAIDLAQKALAKAEGRK